MGVTLLCTCYGGACKFPNAGTDPRPTHIGTYNQATYTKVVSVFVAIVDVRK